MLWPFKKKTAVHVLGGNFQDLSWTKWLNDGEGLGGGGERDKLKFFKVFIKNA